MPKSIRIRTEPGVDRNINVKIDQDFDSLEILSLKLRQEDLYTQFCADYGVVVGRVIANGGVGVPNAHISIFIPIDQIDENDPVISTLYPYKSPEGKNEDGYRYNLLPYKDEYYGHNATGTFPTAEDVLTRKEVLHVYEKYYKYSVRTNESGDFMIVGVPLGSQKLVMDLDLSNMGEFSLRPSDLIRMGRGIPSQFNGQLFKDSENIDSLPQIVHEVKDIDVSSFWGADDTCDVGISRADFDLRELGIEIIPHCVFMGSIMSTSEDDFLKASCRPKKDVGNLCDLTTGPGQVLAIRQTISEDENGDPVLEEYNLEEGGNIIDDNGTWLTELPMNLDYVVTNEFGERVTSADPTVGIPTKSKYRFKIKWMNEGGLQESIQRANYLVPNIREHWSSSPSVGTYSNLSDNEFNKSYSFSLDWNDYADKTAAINCEDTFYQFNYNKVYTVASHIDRYKWGFNRASHLGIKEITDRACQSENNKFPVNEGIRNFDFINFIVQLLLTILSPIIYILIVVGHVVAFLYEILRFIINKVIIPLINFVYKTLCIIVAIIPFTKLTISDCLNSGIDPLGPFPMSNLPLPMMSYPDCEACPCESTTNTNSSNDYVDNNQSFSEEQRISPLAPFNDWTRYVDLDCTDKDDYPTYLKFMYAGWDGTIPTTLGNESFDQWYRTPIYFEKKGLNNTWRATDTISMGQSLNLMNQRSRYFDAVTPNIIRTQIINDPIGANSPTAPSNGINQFEDLPLIMVLEAGNDYSPGQLLTFHDIENINDPNIDGLPVTTQFGNSAVTGQVEYNASTFIPSTLQYIPPGGSNNVTVNLQLANTVLSEKAYNFKSGVEYFQVVTATTVGDIFNRLSVATTTEQNSSILWKYFINKDSAYVCHDDGNTIVKNTLSNLIDYENLVFVVLTRGVDPYSPKQKIRYDLSKLFGKSYGNDTVEGDYYLNIPIRSNGGSASNNWYQDKLTPAPHDDRIGSNYVSNNNNNNVLFHNSFMFKVDDTLYSSFTVSNFARYSSIDKSISTVLNSYGSSNGYETKSDNEFRISHSNGTLGRIEGSTYQYGKKSFDGKINDSITNDGRKTITVSTTYKQNTIAPAVTQIDVYSNTNQPLVFRSDRLPGSSGVNEGIRSNTLNVQNFIFHLNDNFKIYEISDDGIQVTTSSNSSSATDGSGNSNDMSGETNSKVSSVLSSFTCESMVPLGCYNGDGIGFGIDTSDPDCNDDEMVGGCYILLRPPYLVTIPNDIINFTEWKARFRYIFAACRGVFGQAFQNNWVNGNLYMPSFQKRTFYNSQNEVRRYKFCGDPEQSRFGMFFQDRQFKGPVYFNTDSNSFYYRSTPFYQGQFQGIDLSTIYPGQNQRQLFFPTTIMDLGPKTDFLKEVMLSPEFESYAIDKIKSTSYQDISGILNLFILSRLANRGFLETLFNLGDDTISASFSRQSGFGNRFTDARMDADYVQMASINSELGVIPYINNNYKDSIFVGSLDSSGLFGSPAMMGIWFTADTETRKIIGPGETQFTPTITNKFGYPNSQTVPTYRWGVNHQKTYNGAPFLFGNQENEWKTGADGIITVNYQNDTIGTGGDYPKSPLAAGTGYLYSPNDDDAMTSSPNVIPTNQPKYRVGSPFYFYFGLKRGKSAMNRLINKYLTIVG